MTLDERLSGKAELPRTSQKMLWFLLAIILQASIIEGASTALFAQRYQTESECSLRASKEISNGHRKNEACQIGSIVPNGDSLKLKMRYGGIYITSILNCRV